jgi:hydrogenase/urease accessory protein HupE
VNVYEDGVLTRQAIIDAGRQTAVFYAGRAGPGAVVRDFVVSGIEHILIGPDHVLFLVALLLLGGTLARLALIVTAFTAGHSVTLTLAALDVVSLPSRLIEPLIALTIVVVGADNLLVSRQREGRSEPGADIRPWLAAVFGLIHGFGFASVLKEFGLPPSALGWSLFAFNAGVEIGQLAIVLAVALALRSVAERSVVAAARLASAGSIGVILAGAYWFIQRTFFPGG